MDSVKRIIGFEDYYADSAGNIWSGKQKRFKALKLNQKKNGYLYVCLSKKGTHYTKRVHRVIYESFYGPLSEDLVIDHRNGKKNDNRLSNLDAVNIRENTNRGYQKRQTSSKYRGVSAVKNKNYFRANITFQRTRYHLICGSEKTCAAVYKDALSAIDNDLFLDFLSDLAEFKAQR